MNMNVLQVIINLFTPLFPGIILRFILELYVTAHNKDLKDLRCPISSLVLSVYFINQRSMFSTSCKLWRKATALTETVVLPSGPGLFRRTGKIKCSPFERQAQNLCQAVEVGKRVH